MLQFVDSVSITYPIISSVHLKYACRRNRLNCLLNPGYFPSLLFCTPKHVLQMSRRKDMLHISPEIRWYFSSISRNVSIPADLERRNAMVLYTSKT